MSTAGKILVGLTLPLMLVWIALIAGVAEYNRKGSLEVSKLQAQAAKLEQEVLEKIAETRSFKDQTDFEQVALGRDMAVIQAKKNAAQEALSVAIEDDARAKIDLTSQESTYKKAQRNRDDRIAETKQTATELHNAESEVERLKEVDSDQRLQLKKLRDEFKRTFDDNRAKIKKVSQ